MNWMINKSWISECIESKLITVCKVSLYAEMVIFFSHIDCENSIQPCILFKVEKFVQRSEFIY